jgi:hypothetical protein
VSKKENLPLSRGSSTTGVTTSVSGTANVSVSTIIFGPDLNRVVLSPIPSVPSREQMADAVYAHIQALRALGRTGVDTSEVASALGLSTTEVNSIVADLGTKGVKVK